MKRAILIASCAVTLAVLFLNIPAFAKQSQIPHENPSLAGERIDTAMLLLQYRNFFNRISAGQYHDAAVVLDDMTDVRLPQDLRYLVNRYNDFCSQLSDTISRLETLLEEAANLIDDNQIDTAVPVLAEADVSLQQAGMLSTEITAATESLTNMTGLMAGASSSIYQTQYDLLQDSLRRIQLLIAEFDRLQDTLQESRLQQQSELTPTQLTLIIDTPSVLAGDTVTVSGILSAVGMPLPARPIEIVTDNKTIATAITDGNGTYTENITVPNEWTFPYRNRDTFTAPFPVKAQYTPGDKDAGVYSGVISRVVVDASVYPTKLDLAAPGTAYPGLPFNISGTITTRDIPERDILVMLDESLLAARTVKESFSVEVKAHLNISSGEHVLKVIVLPAGASCGTSVSQSMVMIRELPVTADIQMTPLVFLSRQISVRGTIYYAAQPIANAVVTVRLNDAAGTVNTSADGSFAASLASGIHWPVFSRQDVSITIQPLADIPITTSITRQISAFNPFTILLLAIVITFLGIRFRRNFVPQPRRETPPSISQPEPALLISRTTESRKPSGISIKILEAYRAGLKAVEDKTGALMHPADTLREFLGHAAALTQETSQQFASLTAIAESALYSTRNPDEAAAAQAEKIAATIKEELCRDTP
ncbi:MAG: DUF4129 domain-containing protein [Dehalococcoidales bacterium]|nr:DUF4129 domain-containing protein [Dehalococcoidales bacterium]